MAKKIKMKGLKGGDTGFVKGPNLHIKTKGLHKGK